MNQNKPNGSYSYSSENFEVTVLPNNKCCEKENHLIQEWLRNLSNNTGYHDSIKELDAFGFSYIYRIPSNGTIKLSRPTPISQPIFYRSMTSGWRCSDEIHKLFSSTEVPRFCKRGLYEFLTLQFVSAPNTIIKGCFKTHPGQTITLLTSGEVKIESVPVINFSRMSKDNNFSLQRNYDNLFYDLSGKFGAFCSGGIDSTTNIVNSVGKLKDLMLLTAGFDDASFDESRYATLLSEHYALDHHVNILRETTVSDLDIICSYLSEPIADRALIPSHKLLSSLPSKLDYILSGEGGDEIFGPPRRWNKLHNIKESSTFEICRNYLEVIAVMREDDRKIITDSHCYDAVYNEILKKFTSFVIESCPNDNFQALKAIQTNTWLIYNVIIKDYAVAQANNTSVIYPLCTNEAIKFIESLSAKSHYQLCSDKEFLRSSFKNDVPYGIIHKPKKKFKVPVSSWLSSSIVKVILSRLNQSELVEMMNVEVLESLLIDCLEGKESNDRLVWGVFVLLSWFTALCNRINNG